MFYNEYKFYRNAKEIKRYVTKALIAKFICQKTFLHNYVNYCILN